MGILEEHSENLQEHTKNLHEHTEILQDHNEDLDNLEEQNEYRKNEIDQLQINSTKIKEILNEHSGNLDNLEQENEFRINEIDQLEIKSSKAEIKIQNNTNALSVVSDDIERIEQILVCKIFKMSNLKYLNDNHFYKKTKHDYKCKFSML